VLVEGDLVEGRDTLVRAGVLIGEPLDDLAPTSVCSTISGTSSAFAPR